MNNVIDELNEIDDKQTIYKMSWEHIANCVHHEMFPALASTMRSIIEQKNQSELYRLEPKHIQQMVSVLKTKRKLAIEESQYIRKLCQRAVQFVPITALNRNSDDDGEKDATQKGMDGLLQDIFDVHRHFIFSNYHFNEYTIEQYSSDLTNVNDEYLKSYLGEKELMVKERFNFHPSYIIHDDIFEVFDSVFTVSQYVHYIRSSMKRKPFSLKLVIIPKSVRSVYHDEIVLKHSIGYTDDYLRGKNVFEYQRITDNIGLKVFLQNNYDTDCMQKNDINNLIIIIDRRYSVHTAYILPCTTFNHFTELNKNYFLAFIFNIVPSDNQQNKVNAYVQYGINEKLRFYPEMMLCIVARTFKRRSDIPEADIVHRMYAHKYKHGFCLDLHDDLFNKYYKIITGYNHVSVNINRALLVKKYSAAKEILFFRDLLEYEMKINQFDAISIHETIDYIFDEDYDSEAIIDDIDDNTGSNIEHYFILKDKQNQFSVIRSIVSKYTDPSEYNKPKECRMDNVFELKHCNYIRYLLETLKRFHDSEFIVNMNEYNICNLLNAYDHLIEVHQFNRFQNNERIKTYFADKIGFCLLDNCSILVKHRMRRREREMRNRELNTDSKDDESEDSIKEIISATLVAMHCYISHQKSHLFRLERSENNTHFITPKDEEDEKTEKNTNKALSVKFGISVLEWLKYDEEPLFASFRDEIVNNKHSTISHKLYLNFVRECFIKLINRKYEQYTLDEMMSLKIYTDTDSYQSVFRKSFWKTASNYEKRSFYHWAMLLYQTMLFHSAPTPRLNKTSKGPISIFHGLNMVFVLDNALPMYHGPISMSLQHSVPHSFSNGTGLLWIIKPSYANKVKFVTGIDVSWISHHKNEAEFLLLNQYLPIVRTQNFDNDVNNNVDHVLYSLKSFKTQITNIEKFYRIIGLIYNDKDNRNKKEKRSCNPEWISIIKSRKQQFLYQPTVMRSRCLLERLVEELGIKVFNTQYKALSSKFQIVPHFAFNYYSIISTFDIGTISNLNTMKCTITDNDDNIEKEFDCRCISMHKVPDHDLVRELLPIRIRNKQLFGCNEYIKIQDISTAIFEGCSNAFYNSLRIQEDKLIILENTIPERYHEEILKCQYVLIVNTDASEKKTLKSDIVYNDNGYIYNFADIDKLHFIIPYKSKLKKVSLYVQFNRNYNFILFKTFDINHVINKDSVSNQVNYLLNVLSSYKHYIADPKEFFQQINININHSHIEMLGNHRLLTDDVESESNNNVLDILIDDLDIRQLSNVRQKQNAKRRAELENIVEKWKNVDAKKLLEATENLEKLRSTDREDATDQKENVDAKNVLETKQNVDRGPPSIEAIKNDESTEDDDSDTDTELNDRDAKTEEERTYDGWRKAVESGNESLVAFLMEEYPFDLFQFHWDNYDSALHVAVKHNHARMVLFLLMAGSSVNEQNKNTLDSALHMAVRNKHRKIIDLLLKYGADVNITNVNRETPITISAEYTDNVIYKTLVPSTDNSAFPQRLVSKVIEDQYTANKAEPAIQSETPSEEEQSSLDTIVGGAVETRRKFINTEVKNEDWTDVVKNNKMGGIKMLHHDDPGLVNEPIDAHGSTALHYAVKNKNHELLDYLLNNGANVNAYHLPDLNTALHEATILHDFAAIQKLYSFGSDDTLRNIHNKTPVELCPKKFREEYTKAIDKAIRTELNKETYLVQGVMLAGMDLNDTNEISIRSYVKETDPAQNFYRRKKEEIANRDMVLTEFGKLCGIEVDEIAMTLQKVPDLSKVWVRWVKRGQTNVTKRTEIYKLLYGCTVMALRKKNPRVKKPPMNQMKRLTTMVCNKLPRNNGKAILEKQLFEIEFHTLLYKIHDELVQMDNFLENEVEEMKENEVEEIQFDAINRANWTPESLEWEKKLESVANAVNKTDITTRKKIWDYFDRRNVEKLDCDKSLPLLIYSFIALYIKSKNRDAKPPKFTLLKPLLQSVCNDIKKMNKGNQYITKHDFETHIAVYLKKIANERKIKIQTPRKKKWHKRLWRT